MKINSIVLMSLCLFVFGCGSTKSWTRFYHDPDGIHLVPRVGNGLVTGKKVADYQYPIAIIESNANTEAKMTLDGVGAFSHNAKSESFASKIAETTLAIATAERLKD